MANDRHVTDLLILEKELNTDLYEGLSSREAKSRLEKESSRKGSKYSLFVPERRSAFSSLTVFLTSPFVVLLLIMSILTALFGRPILGLSVFVITLAASVFGGILSLKSAKKLADMREYAAPMVRVKRGGNIFYTDGRNLVNGDVIILGEGDLLPCDARIIKCSCLEIDEIYHTAEGIQKRRVTKNADVVYGRDSNIGKFDALNMLYAGSAVISGRAVALVVETGKDVALSDHIPEGALGGRDADSEGTKRIKTLLYKISFVCASCLLILSLLSLLTLNGKESFICSFTMLLSAIFLISTELLKVGTDFLYSSFLRRLSKQKSSKRKRDNSAVIRSAKALDSLTEVTDLVLLGSAGLISGILRVDNITVGGKEYSELTAEESSESRILDLIYTYVKAKRDSEIEKLGGSDGITDALYAYLRHCGYDAGDASLVTRSLYLAKDAKNGFSYACVETESDFYRTTLVDDLEILKECNKIREGSTVRDITSDDIIKTVEFCKHSTNKCIKHLVCVSENDVGVILEGIVSLEQPQDNDLVTTVKEMLAFGINLKIFMPDENDESKKIISSMSFSELFEGKIIYASTLRDINRSITDAPEDCIAYVGFTNEEYVSLITKMRRNGAKIAAYGVDNRLNEVMARADVGISCDVLKYSSDKHREAVYERMPVEGKASSLRASQQTRLLAKVIVKRAHNDGGGVASIFKAIRLSRGAHVTFGHSLLLFTLLMSSLLTFSIMSVLTGNILLDPLQTVALVSVFAFLPITVFTDSEQLSSQVSAKRDFVTYPYELVSSRCYEIISRVTLAAVVAITVRILDACGIFGASPNYTMPIFICMCLTLFAEVFLINISFTKRGEGRGYCWLKVIVAYAILLFVCYLSTQKPFSDEFMPNGIGSSEYLIVPAYIVLYCITVAITRLIAKYRKNH